jgi:hypothetical protein
MKKNKMMKMKSLTMKKNKTMKTKSDEEEQDD